MIANTIKTMVSTFSGNSFTGGQNDISNGNLLVSLITLVVFVVILLFIGKYIWNECEFI